MSLERGGLPRSFVRIALIVAIALLIDGAAVSMSPHPALASGTTNAPVVNGQTDPSLASAVATETTGSNPVVAQAVSPRTTTYAEGSSRFTWSGTWSTTTYVGYLGHRAKYSKARGASATFRFTGTRVSWIGPVGPTRGSARVYVDGRLVKTVSTFSSSFVARRTLFTRSWSTQGAHTLKIVVVGTARHPTVAIDAMIVRSLVTVTSPPPANPTPPPSGGGSYRTSGPISITRSNVVIDGVSISSSGVSGIGIVAEGTASNPIENITIRNCKVKGFRLGIEVRHAKNVVVQNCIVTDADFVGIGYFSVGGGRISNNTVQRIGMTRTNFSTGILNNAYGIVLDRNSSASLTTDPRVTNVVVDHNLVEDVPLWMGINTHAGAHLTFSNNIVRRTPRAIFVAGDGGGNSPIDVTITGNRLEQPVTKSGGTTNIEGILISNLSGGAITNNAVARAYGSPNGTDYGGASTGITRSGNVSIP